MKKLIDFIGVTVLLGKRTLFSNLTFSVYEGDCYMVLGKNGSGKTLLLELIFGGYTNELCQRYKDLKVEGKILDCEGNDLLDPGTNRKISYVTQYEDFHNNATFLSEGKSAARGIGIEFDEGYFDELLGRFGLLDKKRQKIKNNVSGGEGKLIHLITRILKLNATNILLLDEPLNHLSFRNSKIFNDIIEEIKAARPELTILMISHCKAISFVDKIMKYDYATEKIVTMEYKSYSCFAVDECEGC